MDQHGNSVLEAVDPRAGAGPTAKNEVCVDPPRGKTRCRTLYLTKGSLALYHADVRWADKFPNRGRGVYRVSWEEDGAQLGPTLGFKLG